MHPARLDERNVKARQRITTAAGALTDALNLAPLEGPNTDEKRQPAIALMRELEGIADVLEAVARALLTDKESHPNGNATEAQSRS